MANSPLKIIASSCINIFMAKLLIKKLQDATWRIFGFQHEATVSDRDDYLTRMKRRLGHETASDIQSHVDLALERIQADNVPNPRIMTMREFFELLALEKAIVEIEHRIEANAVFVDSNGLLPTLGLSRDVLRLLDGQESPGSMSVENVEKFLGMVQDTTQRLPVDLANETADHFRKRRQELIEFLERAVRMGESVWCLL